MVTEAAVNNLVNEFNKLDTRQTFAEFIAALFKDKFIEIYLSDSYEEISTEQVSTAYPAVFCGKVVAAYKECLVISAVYIDKSEKPQLGNLLFISERAIKALNEIDGKGIMEDMFMRSKESLIVPAIFKKK